MPNARLYEIDFINLGMFYSHMVILVLIVLRDKH